LFTLVERPIGFQDKVVQSVPECQPLPYLTGKAYYRLALRPPVGPMRIPELTLRLLEPLWNLFSKVQDRAPILLSLFTWNYEMFSKLFSPFHILLEGVYWCYTECQTIL